MSWRKLASEVCFDSFSPNSATLVEMHFRHITLLETVDGLGKIFTGSLLLNLFDRVKVSLESEHKCLRPWKAV